MPSIVTHTHTHTHTRYVFARLHTELFSIMLSSGHAKHQQNVAEAIKWWQEYLKVTLQFVEGPHIACVDSNAPPCNSEGKDIFGDLASPKPNRTSIHFFDFLVGSGLWAPKLLANLSREVRYPQLISKMVLLLSMIMFLFLKNAHQGIAHRRFFIAST